MGGVGRRAVGSGGVDAAGGGRRRRGRGRAVGVAVGEEREFVDGEVVAGAEDADAAALVKELVCLKGPVGGVAPDVDALSADAEAAEEEDAHVDGEVV